MGWIPCVCVYMSVPASSSPAQCLQGAKQLGHPLQTQAGGGRQWRAAITMGQRKGGAELGRAVHGGQEPG